MSRMSECFGWKLALALVIGVVAVVAAPVNVAAQEDDDSNAWLEEVAQPGAAHDVLEPMVGEFTTVVKIWWSPDQKPEEYKGTATRTWRLGGRFLEEVAGNPVAEGEKFETIGFWGFNRVTGQYENYWLNTESTGMYIETGRYDPAANVIRTRGEYADPGTGYIAQNRTDLAINGPDQHTMTGYTTYSDGVEFKTIEVVYTRVK